MDQNWYERSMISAVGTTGTSAALNGDIIDLASNGGWNSLMGIAQLSASAADAQLIFQCGSASDSLSDTTGNVLGTKTTLCLDVLRPVHRFGRFVLEAGSATVAYETLATIVYNARKLPSSQPASTTGLSLSSPGTGTASG
jgi:hypothetical protein